MATSPTSRPAEPSSAATKRSSWWSRVRSYAPGAHILSWDLGFGVLGGVAIALLFTASQGVRAQAFTFFLTLGGIGAGLSALVLAPMGMLLSSLSPGFIELINQTRTGLRGLLLPFRSVATIGAVASVLALGVSLASVADLPVLPWWVHFVGTFIPSTAFCWAVFGCIQMVGISVNIIEQDRKFRALDERRDRARRKAG